jgi:hypothetical protein
MTEGLEPVWQRFPLSNGTLMSITAVQKWSEFLATERRCIVFPVRYKLNLYMLCRRKWSSGQSSWLQNGDVLCFL